MPDPFDTVLDLHAQGRLAEAEVLCRRIIAAEPGRADALLILGMVRAQSGDLREGLSFIDRSLGLAPDVPLGHCFRGWVLTQARRPAEALVAYRRAVELQPDHVEAWFNSAHLLFAAGRLEEALAAFDAVLRIEPGLVDARCARAVVLSKLNRLDQALTTLNDVVAANPGFTPGLNLRSDLFSELGRSGEALADAERSLALDPNQAPAHVSRATALIALHRPDEAEGAVARALQLQPNLAAALMLRGTLHRQAGRFAAALVDGDRSIALAPGDAMAHVSRGAMLMALGRNEDALGALNRAAELAPQLAKVYATRALALRHLQNYDAALADCDRALAIDPALTLVPAERFLLAGIVCDWRQRAARLADLARRVGAGEPVNAWVVATSIDDPALQLAAAKSIARPASAPRPHTPPHDRLRIAYLSPDYHEHPSANLIVELIERHDRARFETFGVALRDGPDNAIRRRSAAAFEHFISAGSLSDADLVAQLRAAEIDIAVDLSGHTGGGRPSVFELRPAPLAVNYAGHPGTIGADWIDYILADPVVIPLGSEAHFSEAVVRLPRCFLPSDGASEVEATPTRAEAGLPDCGFVFCSINANYKITPEMFDVWMRLLAATEGSVLWLLVDNATARRNLQAEASARGIDPGRLVFADRLPRPSYLARLKLADLFLDTLPCNAHTTASDALRMGVPLVTAPGRGFAARVAASLVTDAGLAELITPDLAGYEALAVALAHTPDRLAALKARLAQPLFDSARLAQAVERAYEAMWRVHTAGLPAAGFAVPDA